MTRPAHLVIHESGRMTRPFAWPDALKPKPPRKLGGR